MDKKIKEIIASKYEKPIITTITLDSFASILLACGHGILSAKIRRGDPCVHAEDGQME